MLTLQKRTRYALYAAMEMARAQGAPVTAGEVAESYDIPRAALAKVMQQLARAGVAAGTRGVGGGYRLARPAEEMTVLDVVSAFEALRPPGTCLLADCEPGATPCRHAAHCRLQRLMDEIDETARATLASTTLATLAGTRPGIAATL